MRILWVSHTAWRVPQRAHDFCRELARRHEVHVVESDTDFATPADYLSVRYFRNLRYSSYRDGDISVHLIPRVSPALFVTGLRRLNAAIFARIVGQIVRRQRVDVVVGTFPLPPPRFDGRLVFDSFDANAEYWRLRGARRYANEVALTEFRYLQQADAVVTASSVLADRARALVPRGPIHHIPNGVDLRRFDRLDRVTARARLGVDGPVVGSVANYDSDVELDMILDAAGRLAGRGITFVVAGRGRALGRAVARARRARLTNVRFLGYVPPDEAPAMIAGFDVGLCSYASSPMDDARTPMRLLMYTAAGLPTVCTDLEEVRRMGFPNVVLVHDDGESVARGVLDALAMPRERPDAIRAYDLPRLVARYEAVLEARQLPDDEATSLSPDSGTSTQRVSAR